MRSDAFFQIFRIFPQERRIIYERELFFVFKSSIHFSFIFSSSASLFLLPAHLPPVTTLVFSKRVIGFLRLATTLFPFDI